MKKQMGGYVKPKNNYSQPPIEANETIEAYTNRLTGADGKSGKNGPYKEWRTRSCRLGWHEECSIPEECKCPCHPK